MLSALLAIAKKLLRQGTRVIFPSTNLVLAGMHASQAADDVYLPRTAYALEKAEVEQRLLKLPRMCVVRFTKVFGRGAPLLREWCKALQEGKVIRPFSDMPMAPVRLDFAVEALAAITAARPEGIVQVSAKQDITYADAGRSSWPSGWGARNSFNRSRLRVRALMWNTCRGTRRSIRNDYKRNFA